MGNRRRWALVLFTVTVLVGVVHVTAQQLLRQAANDPQIQNVVDWADQLSRGVEPTALKLGISIDPTVSLASFGIVYDKDGKIVASSVTAPSSMQQPNGVFDSVSTAPNSEARFTWQPASGARFATVIKKVQINGNHYFVLSGRNLSEVERRQRQISYITISGWGATLLGALILLTVPNRWLRLPRRG